jgi:two-component system, LytTR family, response regulator
LTERKRILVVDDEPLARQRIKRYLAQSKPAFVIDEAESGLEAVTRIRAFRPDIVFLDIEMPGLSGFEVLQQFNERPFQVVFQTAFDEFAVRAFEEHASDYLLKPFTEERFNLALARVLARAADEERLIALETEFAKRHGYLKKLTVKQGGKLRVIEEDDIVCFVSRDHYTCVYFQDGREAICELSLASLLERLDPEKFRPFHRNNIIRLATIKALNSASNEEMTLELSNQMNLPVSRSHRREVRDLLKSLSR